MNARIAVNLGVLLIGLLTISLRASAETTSLSALSFSSSSEQIETGRDHNPIFHPLFGSYLDELGNNRIDINSSGRITTVFTLSLATGQKWNVLFPHVLQKVGAGKFSTRGTIQGLWSNGVLCNYPATMSFTQYLDSSLDSTAVMPQHFNTDCSYSGRHEVLWALTKIQ